MKRTEIGLLSRRATKPRSGRNSAANTASSAARRPGSSVTRVPASPRATRTTSPPTSGAPRPPRDRRPRRRRRRRSGPRRSRAAAPAARRVPSLATTTRFSGDCASCLSARSTTVRPAIAHRRARLLGARRRDDHDVGGGIMRVRRRRWSRWRLAHVRRSDDTLQRAPVARQPALDRRGKRPGAAADDARTAPVLVVDDGVGAPVGIAARRGSGPAPGK